MLISPRLYQDVQHDAMLIDRPPQPVAWAADLQRNFVEEVPLVAGSGSCLPEHAPAGIIGSELMGAHGES